MHEQAKYKVVLSLSYMITSMRSRASACLECRSASAVIRTKGIKQGSIVTRLLTKGSEVEGSETKVLSSALTKAIVTSVVYETPNALSS